MFKAIYLFIWKIHSYIQTAINKHQRTSRRNMKTERHQGNALTDASKTNRCSSSLFDYINHNIIVRITEWLWSWFIS